MNGCLIQEGRKCAQVRTAFTLLELLVVVAIIVILTAALVPATNSMMRGFHLTQATDQIVSELNLARQAAITNNHSAEVRFYQFGDAEIPGQQVGSPSSGQYRAMQVFVYDEKGNAAPMGKMERLPVGIIIDSGTYSTLLGISLAKTFTPPLDAKVSIPMAGTNYNAEVFQFRPDGTTNLLIGGNWYLTIHNAAYGDQITTLPTDFATIQVDPIGGAITTFRR